jgi:replication-associated recombination protein RarA
MIEGGEDVKFIARRMLILASEDIGNANPTALIMANSTFQAVSIIGNPESRIILSQCAIYLATSPKSNASYEAIGKAQHLVRETGPRRVVSVCQQALQLGRLVAAATTGLAAAYGAFSRPLRTRSAFRVRVLY